MPCYVRGCDEPTVIGRIHKLTGRVDACRGHDPESCGYARSFGVPPAAKPEEHVVAPEETPEQLMMNLVQAMVRLASGGGPHPPAGGSRVPRRPIPPTQPTPSAAVRPFGA